MNTYLPNGKETILMVFMFRGKYLTNMLGHEIINLFQADDGKHYIYVNPWGNISKDQANKIGTILFVRHTNNYQVEVIAKAWDLSSPFPGSTDVHMHEYGRKDENKKRKGYDQKLKDVKDKQREACKEISYGNIPITEIFNFNDPDDKQHILVSFRAEQFRRTRETVVIRYNDKDVDMGEMPRQTLKSYLKKGDKGYDEIKAIIENEEKWMDSDKPKTISENKGEEDSMSILNVIGKADDELAFSNWLHYYFKKNAILNSFAKEVLGLNNAFSVKTEVLREEKHIDLLVKDSENKQLIVIENKIKSGINGRQESASNNSDSNTDSSSNQLDRYKGTAKDIANEEGIPLDSISYYLFLPNYSAIKYDETNNKCCGYKVIKYDRIHSFFEGYYKKSLDSHLEQKTFDILVLEQFIKALNRHTSSYPDSLFEDTYRQFVERIAELNKIDKDR